MKNPFNIIKRKAESIRKREEVMQAAVDLAAKAKAEGWSPERLQKEVMQWADQMIRRSVEQSIGKDVDKMVDAMLQNEPRAKAYQQQVRQEVMAEFLKFAMTGEEPNLEQALIRAFGEDKLVGQSESVQTKADKPTMTVDEMQHRMAAAASVVKLVCGVGNNAAWLVVLEAYDHAKQHSRFNQSMKGGKRYSWFFRRVMKLHHEYEDHLVETKTNRMFHLADMDEKTRKKYGDISDRDYYDFWAAIGGPAYHKTHPLVTSLWNKYRLSLEANGIREADKVAWVMVGQVALELAGSLYDSAIDECEKGYELPRNLLEYVFGQFSLKHIAKEWYRAMMTLAPETEPVKPSELEEKNIDLGIRQLQEAWLNHDLLYESTQETVADYDEVFSTKGHQKKVLREIGEIREDTQREYERLKKEGKE